VFCMEFWLDGRGRLIQAGSHLLALLYLLPRVEYGGYRPCFLLTVSSTSVTTLCQLVKVGREGQMSTLLRWSLVSSSRQNVRMAYQ
jgi:hypothetical protein